MLTQRCQELSGPEVEARVLDLIAETSGFDSTSIAPETPLTEVLDSLTLAAVAARVEAAFHLELGADEAIELLAARDVGELCRLIARSLGRTHANLDEKTGNESC